MSLTVHLRILGVLFTALGLAHATFPRYFRWREELASVSPLTREMHLVHSAYIGLTVFLQGLLCLFLPFDLQGPSRLGFAVSVGLGLFWASRLAVQLFVYSPAHWRGKRMETAAHIAATLLWAYAASLFLISAWNQRPS